VTRAASKEEKKVSKVKLKVLGADWEMEDVPPDHDRLARYRGVTASATLYVVIDKTMPKQRKWITRFHELVHVADAETCVQQLSEEEINRIARALWAILRDNPHLLPLCGLGGGK